MDSYLKKIFELYMNDEIYTDQIAHDIQYKDTMKNIRETHDKILSFFTDQTEDIDHLIKHLFDMHMHLSNIYRYYDFTEGFALGLMAGKNIRQKDKYITDKMDKIIYEMITQEKE